MTDNLKPTCSDDQNRNELCPEAIYNNSNTVCHEAINQTGGAIRSPPLLVGFNAVFASVNRCEKRYRVLLGSAGSGKSYNVAQDYIIRLSDPDYTGGNLLVIRRSETSNRDSTFAELTGAIRRVFGGHAEKFWKITTEPLMLESLVTGNRIIFRGMLDERQRERIKSVSFPRGKLCFIWCEEATELRAADFDILDDRLRGDLTAINPRLYYQITLTFNPVDGRHWIKPRFFDRNDCETFTHRSTYLDNAFIDPAYHRRMKLRSETDPEGYAVYGLGEWGSSGGRIFTKYKVEPVSGDFGDYDHVCAGQDFGFNHANALVLCGFRDGDVYVMRELYMHEMDTSQIIAAADEADFPKRVPMYCDSAEPDRIRTWRAAGYMAEAVKKEPGSVAAQIDYLQSHRLTVDPSCVNLLAELAVWSWSVDSVSGQYTDVPTPVFDDAIAALRYSIETERRGGKLKTMSKTVLGI